MQNCGQVFHYAVASGHADRDISSDLRGAIPPSKEKHHASVTAPKDVAALLRIIETYQGSFVTMSAAVGPVLFVRPGELRHAQWSEVDFDKAEWRIPAAKMKMREQHIVPLCRQAIAFCPWSRTRSTARADWTLLNRLARSYGHRARPWPEELDDMLKS